MIRFVLDASVALRWYLSNPVPIFARQIKQIMLGGAQAVVPWLWHLEMANGLAVAGRRAAITTADVDLALTDLELLLGEAIESDSELVPVRYALSNARTFQLSAYDAVYLELARREGLPLATLDEQLRAAATRAGVSLVR